jgi:hypothetical protein
MGSIGVARRVSDKIRDRGGPNQRHCIRIQGSLGLRLSLHLHPLGER